MKITVVTTITTTIPLNGNDEVTHDMAVASEGLPENLVVATALSACKAGVAALEERTPAKTETKESTE